MRQLALPSLLFAVSLALSGCGQQKTVDVKNESVSNVTKKVADANLHFAPGRWESTMKFVKMDMTGVPPEAQAMMQKAMGKGRTFASCLTKEEAEKPDSKFFGQADERCKYDTFSMGSGKIDAKMTCTTEHGAQVMTMNGTYTPDSYDMAMAIKGGGPAGQSMDMSMALSAKRTGECTGKEVS